MKKPRKMPFPPAWVKKAWSAVWPVIVGAGVKVVLEALLPLTLEPHVLEHLPRVILV